MNRNFCVTPIVKSLFSNAPVESGLTDSEITQGDPHIRHKTFSRHRRCPPTWISREELRMIARLAGRGATYDAADVLSMVRAPQPQTHHSLWLRLLAQSISRSDKALAQVERQVKLYAPNARRIYLFDREDSFSYLRPPIQEDDSQVDDFLPQTCPKICPKISFAVRQQKEPSSQTRLFFQLA